MTRRARRLALGGIAFVVVLAITSAVAWFVWLPRFLPALRAGERYGVDVSHRQGSIDWSRVAADGIDSRTSRRPRAPTGGVRGAVPAPGTALSAERE